MGDSLNPKTLRPCSLNPKTLWCWGPLGALAGWEIRPFGLPLGFGGPWALVGFQGFRV